MEQPTTDPTFLFTCCQHGAEAAVKADVARALPDARLAFSRPGLVTFKTVTPVADNFDMKSAFVRCWGFGLGQVRGNSADELVRQTRQLFEARSLKSRHLHCWQRDPCLPGTKGFEPGETVLASEIGRQIADDWEIPVRINRRAKADDAVLDCLIVEPNQWLIGYHHARDVPARWPGGVLPYRLPSTAVNRTYLKMVEALAWSKLPIRRGDVCAEIGSSPGGSCQVLLDKGLQVIGIDPGEMDERVLKHPRFLHIRKRASEVKRSVFDDVRWLTADSNVAPQHTLDSVQAIVTQPTANVRGMLLTLKLLEWNLAEQLPNYLAQIRNWGYHHVRARQLAFNRQEVCIAALRRRAMKRMR